MALAISSCAKTLSLEIRQNVMSYLVSQLCCVESILDMLCRAPTLPRHMNPCQNTCGLSMMGLQWICP